jgi:hypothetical protein
MAGIALVDRFWPVLKEIQFGFPNWKEKEQ